jgi:hypothetical protein
MRLLAYSIALVLASLALGPMVSASAVTHPVGAAPISGAALQIAGDNVIGSLYGLTNPGGSQVCGTVVSNSLGLGHTVLPTRDFYGTPVTSWTDPGQTLLSPSIFIGDVAAAYAPFRYTITGQPKGVIQSPIPIGVGRCPASG